VANLATSSSTAPAGTALGPASQRVLEYILAHRGRAPDAILPDVLGYRPHLFYAPSFYMLCPEPGEDAGAMRDDLEDAGNNVLLIRSDQDIETQLSRAYFWRGEGN
jgi:hypothetical protein